MNDANIQRYNGQMQDTGKCINMRQRVTHPYPSMWNLYHLLDTLIRDYAQRVEDGYYLYANELSLSEKRLVLSYLVDSEDYDDVMASPTMTEALFVNHKKFIQDAIDYQCGETYQDFLESATYCRE